jgi:hypothetical protein
MRDDYNPLIEAYNKAIPAIVQARIAAGQHVILVDMYSAFTANPDGHAQIGPLFH